MANKTAKTNARLERQVHRKLVGKKILYIGAGPGVAMTCPVCSRSQKRGMVSQYENVLYCSEGCVNTVAKT